MVLKHFIMIAAEVAQDSESPRRASDSSLSSSAGYHRTVYVTWVLWPTQRAVVEFILQVPKIQQWLHRKNKQPKIRHSMLKKKKNHNFSYNLFYLNHSWNPIHNLRILSKEVSVSETTVNKLIYIRYSRTKYHTPLLLQ